MRGYFDNCLFFLLDSIRAVMAVKTAMTIVSIIAFDEHKKDQLTLVNEDELRHSTCCISM